MTDPTQIARGIVKGWMGIDTPKEKLEERAIDDIATALREYGEAIKGKCPIHEISRGIVCTVCVVEAADAEGYRRGVEDSAKAVHKDEIECWNSCQLMCEGIRELKRGTGGWE